MRRCALCGRILWPWVKSTIWWRFPTESVCHNPCRTAAFNPRWLLVAACLGLLFGGGISFLVSAATLESMAASFAIFTTGTMLSALSAIWALRTEPPA